ncbi:MAG: autotransporter-associated beta strand protein [Candidatus Promineifilaceae bacterium]
MGKWPRTEHVRAAGEPQGTGQPWQSREARRIAITSIAADTVTLGRFVAERDFWRKALKACIIVVMNRAKGASVPARAKNNSMIRSFSVILHESRNPRCSPIVLAAMLLATQAAWAQPTVDNGSGATPGRGIATLNGDVISTNGAATTAYTFWGESDGGTNTMDWDQSINNGVLSEGPFATNTPPTLLFGKRYYYRTYATNINGEAWAAATTSFLTLSPSIETVYINYDSGGTKPVGVGVVGNPGDLWNQSSGGSGWKDVSTWNIGSLADTTGAAIPSASLAITQPPNFLGHNGTQVVGVGGGAPPPTSLPAPFDFSLGDALAGKILWTFNGLSDATTYDVYVFWKYSGAGQAPASITVNGSAPQTLTYASVTALPAEGRDYRRYSGIVATGAKIEILTTCPDTNGGISGFQIVSVIPPPSLVNTAATGYTFTNAVLHATLDATDSVYDVYAYWNTVDGGTNVAAWTNSAFVGTWTNAQSVAIDAPVSGLISNALYYFTFRAVNEAEELWAPNVLSFPNRENEILTFGLPGMPSVIAGTNITWTIAHGSDVSNLAPEYTVSTDANGNPASGSTQDFTGPQVYTVTAQDFSMQSYLVTVTNGPRPNDFYWIKANPAGGNWSDSSNWTNETGLAGAPLAGGGDDYHLHFDFEDPGYVATHDLGNGFLLNQLSIDNGTPTRQTLNISGNSLVFTTNDQGQLPRINVNKDENFVISSALVLADDLYIGGNQNANITISAAISGGGGIIRTRGGGWGSLLLSGPKTFAGGLTLGAPGFTDCTVRIDDVASLGTGTLRSEIVNAQLICASINLAAGAGVINNIEIADEASLIIETRETGYHIKLSGTISGSGDLRKQNSATLTLTGVNTLSGTTTLAGGTLVLDNSLALQNSTLDYINGTVVFASGFTNVTLGGLSGDEPLTLANASSDAIALAVGGNGDTTSFSGGLSGAGSLTKMGAGMLTLAGENSYSGTTAVVEGSLGFTATNGLDVATDLYIDPGTGLQLDYSGIISVNTFYIDGIKQPIDLYSTNNLPAYISGTGIIAPQKGSITGAFMLIVR